MTEINITDRNFLEEVEKSTSPVLVDFWAPWCGPCRMLSPMIKELADEYQGRAKIGKVNTDENPTTAMRFHIAAIPTLLFFKNGKLVNQVSGVRPKPEIKSILDQLI